MLVLTRIKKNTYRDSMQLMQMAEQAKKLKGIIDAAAMMASENNKQLLKSIGMLTEEGEKADADDIILVVSATDRESAERALEMMENESYNLQQTQKYFELDEALKNDRVNLGVVSVPGEYAKEFVIPMLDKGVSVHLFSDHVSIEDELYMKNYAKSKGLLLLGPSAGTSILGGKGIAFANSVRRGNIGIISASGTGLQEVSVLLSIFGHGVSQGFGVGGRDLSDYCMGIMTKSCIELLEGDDETQAVCIISKPPGRNALADLIDFIKNKTKKDYVLCLLGADEFNINEKRVRQAFSLHSAAKMCIEVIDERDAERAGSSFDQLIKKSEELRGKIKGKREFVRGLFTGGTLAYESLIILRDALGRVYSNTPLSEEERIDNPFTSLRHTIIDMGEEEFTEGRLHPMIDPSIRRSRLKQELADDSVAVIMLDVMLGYGSSNDPAEHIVSAIERKQDMPAILAHVCGTDKDPQNLASQVKKIEDAGITNFISNAEMSFVAANILKPDKRELGMKLFKKYLG